MSLKFGSEDVFKACAQKIAKQYFEVQDQPPIESWIQDCLREHFLAQIAEDAEKIRKLREALIANAPMKSNQFGKPCWCNTIAETYCVGQEQCEAINKVLKETEA